MCEGCDCDGYTDEYVMETEERAESAKEMAGDLAAKLCEIAGHRHRYPDCREPECANRFEVLERGATYFPTSAERLRLAS